MKGSLCELFTFSNKSLLGFRKEILPKGLHLSVSVKPGGKDKAAVDKQFAQLQTLSISNLPH
jgi:hypothetical protein